LDCRAFISYWFQFPDISAGLHRCLQKISGRSGVTWVTKSWWPFSVWHVISLLLRESICIASLPHIPITTTNPSWPCFFFWFWSTLDGCFGYFYFLLLTIIDFDGHLNVVSSIDRIKMFYVRKIQLRKIPVQFGLGRQLNTSSFEKIICAIPFDEIWEQKGFIDDDIDIMRRVCPLVYYF
jgi:hypothetical protein